MNKKLTAALLGACLALCCACGAAAQTPSGGAQEASSQPDSVSVPASLPESAPAESAPALEPDALHISQTEQTGVKLYDVTVTDTDIVAEIAGLLAENLSPVAEVSAPDGGSPVEFELLCGGEVRESYIGYVSPTALENARESFWRVLPDGSREAMLWVSDGETMNSLSGLLTDTLGLNLNGNAAAQ